MSEATESRAVGRVPFADGVEREVYEAADGRQWVVGYDGGARVRRLAAAGGRAGRGRRRGRAGLTERPKTWTRPRGWHPIPTSRRRCHPRLVASSWPSATRRCPAGSRVASWPPFPP